MAEQETEALAPVDGQAVAFHPPPMRQVLADAQERATAVAQIIEDRKLYERIGKKKYVQVEGWNTLAASYGLVPDIEWTRPMDGGGFEARAVLKRMADGFVVAHAESQCGTADDGHWSTSPLNAQRSMAQTRAASKVCRLALSWVIVLAGFQATPADEITREMREESRDTRKAMSRTDGIFKALVKAFPRSDSETQPNWAKVEDFLKKHAPEAFEGKSIRLSKLEPERQQELIRVLEGEPEDEPPPEEEPA